MSEKLMSLESDAANQIFSDIKVIYTDLDGTLFAPKGRLLVDYAGNPSIENAKAITDLQNLGIKIIIVTGRNRSQGTEIIKILNADCFIGEMGTTKQSSQDNPFDIEYDTGTFDWDKDKYETPFKAIGEGGALEALLAKYEGKLERNTPWDRNRDVTHSLRGDIDPVEATEYLHSLGFNLDILNNGALNGIKHTLEGCDVVNGYHIVPSSTSKALAVKRDMEAKGYDPAQCVSIGDGMSDVNMGMYTGAFVLMRNGMDNPANVARAEEIDCNVFATTKRCCDGWVEFANAIKRAKGIS